MFEIVPFVKLADFEREDGSIDWDGKRKAEVANGERCLDCGAHIMFHKGYRTRCDACARLNGNAEIEHSSKIRCPKCGYSWSPFDSDYYELFGDGEHTVGCHDCEHEFTVTTYVSYSFKSPTRLPEEEEEEEAEGEEGEDEEGETD